jgi:hypothetical protein
LLWICLTVAAVPVFASNAGHVVIRENVSAAKRQELVGKLRVISGWSKLDFDRDGILRPGVEETNTGSQRARDLLTKAFDSAKLIVIEDASSRSDVVFCRVVAARRLRDSGPKFTTFVVLIDFVDFQRVMGDKQARAAFNVGWAFLHELDHVIENSEDPTTAAPGDCEDHINQMREQVGLPIRSNYFFIILPLHNDPHLVTKFVRLRFEKRGESNQVKAYWLIWDAALVGGLPEERQTASLQNSASLF